MKFTHHLHPTYSNLQSLGKIKVSSVHSSGSVGTGCWALPNSPGRGSEEECKSAKIHCQVYIQVHLLSSLLHAGAESLLPQHATLLYCPGALFSAHLAQCFSSSSGYKQVYPKQVIPHQQSKRGGGERVSLWMEEDPAS